MMKMKKMLTDKFITDELCHYFCRMPGHRFGFHMEIYFDEMCVYKDYSDIPFILIGNTYDMNDYDFLALTIEECPKLLIKKDVHIFREDYISIINWISKNRSILSAFANDEIDFSDAMNLLTVDNKKILNESLLNFPIYEMSRLKKRDSGLKYDLWLDNDQTYVKGGHWHRIKVEDTKHSNKTTSWNTLTLNGYEFIGDDSKNYKSSDKRDIVEFVDNNKELIMDLADRKITFEEFKKRFVKNGEDVNNKIIDVPEPVAKDIEWTTLYTFSNGYSIVLNKNFKYNVENPDGELISDIWFSEISYELNRDKDGIYFICYDYINDKIYKLYTDSHFVLEKLNPDDYSPIIRKYKMVNENRNFFLKNRSERELSLYYLKYLFPKMC